MTEQEKTLEDFQEEEQEVNEPSTEEEMVEKKVEETQVDVDSEVTLDDLDDVPDSEKFRKIKPTEAVDVTELTICNVKLGRPLTKNDKGEFVEPETNANGGKYYKSKLIVEFTETINGDKIREFIPSIFYSVDEGGNINPIPTVPKPCPDSKLKDNFTSEISKIRNMFGKFVNKDPKDISSAQFVKGLIGKKVSVEIDSGDYKGKPWQKLKINGFI